MTTATDNDMMINNLIDKCTCTRYGAEFDVAQVIYAMYKGSFRFNTDEKWYMFDNDKNAWVNDYKDSKLQIILSTEVVTKFLQRSIYYAELAMHDADNRATYDEKAKKLTDIAEKLKISEFKNKVIKECTYLFFNTNPNKPSNVLKFYFAKVQPTATIPQRATLGSAGYDLSACEEAVVPARGYKMVNTGIATQFPSDHYARIAPRSGLTLKKGLLVGAGVIDSDYTGEMRVILFNHTDNDFSIQVGDRIAQLIFERISTPEVKEVYYDELSQTERGAGGFGSTGV